MSGDQGSDRMTPNDDPSWASYARTILGLGPDLATRIDLRAPVTSQGLAALAPLGLKTMFAVLTACNPRGRVVSAAENDRRTATLHAWLKDKGVPFVRAAGLSPDGEHAEPGVAVSIPQEDAVRLAVRYEQSALYWFDGARFWIVGALVETSPVLLPLS